MALKNQQLGKVLPQGFKLGEWEGGRVEVFWEGIGMDYARGYDRSWVICDGEVC